MASDKDKKSKSDDLNSDLNWDIPEVNWDDFPKVDWNDFPKVDFEALKIELSSIDSEFNADWSAIDLPEWGEPFSFDNDSDQIPEPDPNLTAKNVAEWMFEQVNSNGELYQRNAAWHISGHFGERFIYRNENNNPAIKREVLNEFLRISLKTVVWNRRERFWRLRQPGDPNGRMVDN